MEISRLSAGEVQAHCVNSLGLDSSILDLSSTEAIAEVIRRAATTRCPCTAATLVGTVLGPLRGLFPDLELAKGVIEETVEAVVAHGDILEEPDLEENSVGSRRLLYSAPPSFVIRESGAAILVGSALNEFSGLSEDLAPRVEFKGHVRHLRCLPDENLGDELRALGLIELPQDYWLKTPQTLPATRYREKMDRLLDSAKASHEIPGLLLLESGRPVRYYRGRWVEPASQSGRFVARRDQKYGAQLWCYAELDHGYPQKFVDLPIAGNRWRGCDEAWHLQMAIDAERGEPQQFKIVSGYQNAAIMQFFSPVPMWARRRWDAVGEPAVLSGCLFAYQFAASELNEEIRFAGEALWLTQLTDATNNG